MFLVNDGSLVCGVSRGRQALGGIVKGGALDALGRALSGRSPFRAGTPSGRSPQGIESRGHGRASPSGLVLPPVPTVPARCASEGENCRRSRNVRTEYQTGSSGWDSGRDRIPSGSGDDCHGGRSQRYVRTMRPARPSPVGTSGNRNRTRRAAVDAVLLVVHDDVLLMR